MDFQTCDKCFIRTILDIDKYQANHHSAKMQGSLSSCKFSLGSQYFSSLPIYLLL